MSEEQSEKAVRWVSILWPVIMPIVGGAFGVYVAFKLLEQRVNTIQSQTSELADKVERYKAEADLSRERMSERLSEIQRDVSYIRGTLEKR
jgi:hypothetical protein